MTAPHRIAIVGLGATGIAIGQSLATRTDCLLVGGVDVSPVIVGRDLGDVLGVDNLNSPVVASIDELPSADAAIVATSSWVDDVEPTIAALIVRGMNVVSICEELRHPHHKHPDVVTRLDELATASGVSVLGTGCNPGMVMDTLPLLLSGLTQEVERVIIHRTAEMGRYGAILAKFGLGLTVEEFAVKHRAGEVMGHVGFEESIAALAHGLGWHLDRVAVDPVRPAVVAETMRQGTHIRIAPGAVAGVIHQARGIRDGRTVIELVTHFGLFTPDDGMEPGDRLTIQGRDHTITLSSPTGYESFLSTVAMACNVLVGAIEARPGFRTMSDLPVSAIASRGSLMH